VRLVALTALAAALAVTSAAATTTRVDTVTASVHKTGRSGVDLVYRGTVHSKVFGSGKVTEYVGGDLRGRFVIRYSHGVVRGTSVAHTNGTGGGGIDVTGTYRLTGGTGRYRHIRGHGTFTGHSSPSLQSASFRQHGRVSFQG
jgi:hypothetical protein